MISHNLTETQHTEINTSTSLTSMVLSFSKEIQISKMVHANKVLQML